jgi:hypothetical protein
MQTKPPIDDFFNNAKSNLKTKKQQDDLIKRTHYFTQENLDWVASMAFFEKMDKSEIVRKALESYIPEKYKKHE